MRQLSLATRLLAIGLLSGLSYLLVGGSAARAQTNWAEQLGFPKGQRVVILHGNDMGLTYECNAAVQNSMEQGPLSSASCVAAGPWFADCVAWSKTHPDQDIGLSLSFVCPSPFLKWGPVARREEVHSLVTVDGYFTESLVRFHLQAATEQVRREAEAQIQRARAMGLQPSHLHPHLGALLVRPDLLRVYLELAQQYWIPAVMVEFTPELVARLGTEGLAINEEMLEAIANYPLPRVDDIQNVPAADSYEAKREHFFEIVGGLRPGITQVFLKPADDSPGMRRASAAAQDRAWEARLLSDPQVKNFLAEQQITFTNWREIMERFEAVQGVRNNADQD